MTMPNLSVKIGSINLTNPIMPASGAFGFEMDGVLDFNRLGALVPKSITKYPRGGNATPRVCEVNGGMINSIGIQSKGLDYYISHILPEYERFTPPLIASISAESIDEYAEMAEKIGKEQSVAALEINISCPNLKGNGQAFGMDATISHDLIRMVKEVTDKPIITKLTPNVTSIQEIAIACEEAGSDGLNVANTILAMAIDIHSRNPKIGNVLGGVSGPTVKPIIVRLIYQVSQVCSIPIIGCGGVMNADDAIEMILAGATAVQVGTASFINPLVMTEIIDGLEAYMAEYDIKGMTELIGKVEIPQELLGCNI